MDLRQQLLAIQEQHKALTPALVVHEASDPAHPLHDRFEWDDSIAGPEYRKIQAGHLIRSVKIRFKDRKDRDQETRAFVAMPDDGPASTYVPVEHVAEDPFMRKLALQQAERELRTLAKKYEHLEEFMEMAQRILLGV